jgi:phosphoribosylaminoimidazole-succinocarboxamide synthase
MERGDQIREGKAKVLFQSTRGPNFLVQYFKDDATAFNAQKRASIEGKGIVNNTVSTWIFQYLQSKNIPTHFVEKLSDREMLVKKVEIIPLEVVVRNRAAGSIVQRLGLAKGQAFQTPLVEFFFKDDSLGDPLVSEGHIFHFGWATVEEMAEIVRRSLEVNSALSALFKKAGLELIDFKLEFGKDAETSLVLLADEFSPDGCRLWDLKTGESKDKDRFRQDLGGVQEAYLEVQDRLRQVLEVV